MPWPSPIRVGGVRNLVPTRDRLGPEPQPSPSVPAHGDFVLAPALPAGAIAILASHEVRDSLLPVLLSVLGIDEQVLPQTDTRISEEHSKVCQFIDYCEEFGTFSVPREFICPISLQAMRRPVVAADGISYDRASAASALLKRPGVSPLTNARMDSTRVFPNLALVALMLHWASERGGV